MSGPARVLLIEPQANMMHILREAIAADPALTVGGAIAHYAQALRGKDALEADVAVLSLPDRNEEGRAILDALIQRHTPTLVVCRVEYKIQLPKDLNVMYTLPPMRDDEASIKAWAGIVRQKCKALSGMHSGIFMAAPQDENHSALASKFKGIVAIGGSTGSTEVIQKILTSLPAKMPSIVVVVHMPPVFTNMYAQRLNNSCALTVKEASPQQNIEPGKVYIAPGDMHMRISRQGDQYALRCVEEPKVNGHRPSVDVLFDSVAAAAGSAAVGVILTGMGADGAQGLLKMRQRGAFTIGQDQASSVVYGMPCVAQQIGAVMKQASTEQIAQVILHYLNNF